MRQQERKKEPESKPLDQNQRLYIDMWKKTAGGGSYRVLGYWMMLMMPMMTDWTHVTCQSLHTELEVWGWQDGCKLTQLQEYRTEVRIKYEWVFFTFESLSLPCLLWHLFITHSCWNRWKNECWNCLSSIFLLHGCQEETECFIIFKASRELFWSSCVHSGEETNETDGETSQKMPQGEWGWQ